MAMIVLTLVRTTSLVARNVPHERFEVKSGWLTGETAVSCRLVGVYGGTNSVKQRDTIRSL